MTRSFFFWRRCCQMLVALGFILAPVCNEHGVAFISGNLLSLDFFGVSFVDPLAFLQSLASGRPHMNALLGVVAVLLVALLLGRVFCSWICPYGLASELCFATRAGKRTGDAGSLPSSVPGRRPFMIKSAIAAAGLVAVLLFLPEPYLNQLSMPGWYTRAMQHDAFFGLMLPGALVFPALLLAEGVAGKRFWCRYLCPQSVLLAMFAALPGPWLRLRFARKRCICPKNDRPCLAACSLTLNPRQSTLVQRLDCTNCGSCADACRRRGKALRLALREDSFPVAPTRPEPEDMHEHRSVYL